MGRQRGIRSGGEDVNHLSGDDSTGLPAAATLHEGILNLGVTLVIPKVFHRISLNLEVAFDEEVLIIGTLDGDVVLSLVLLLKSCELGVVLDMVSKEVDVLERP